MMDYIDSLRVACWHQRSNRTLGSFTPLKYVQNTVFSLWPAQISILHVWCSAIRLSLQTLHLNVTKPKPFSCRWKFPSSGSGWQSSVSQATGPVSLSLPSPFVFPLIQQSASLSGWNKSLMHHVVWNIRLYTTFFPSMRLMSASHLTRWIKNLSPTKSERLIVWAVRRRTQMVLERLIMFCVEFLYELCFTTTQWKLSLMDLTAVGFSTEAFVRLSKQ